MKVVLTLSDNSKVEGELVDSNSTYITLKHTPHCLVHPLNLPYIRKDVKKIERVHAAEGLLERVLKNADNAKVGLM